MDQGSPTNENRIENKKRCGSMPVGRLLFFSFLLEMSSRVRVLLFPSGTTKMADPPKDERKIASFSPPSYRA